MILLRIKNVRGTFLTVAKKDVYKRQIQEQTEQVLKNIGAILEEAGTDFDHVVKTTCFLSDMNDFVPFNEVYKTVFTTEMCIRDRA